EDASTRPLGEGRYEACRVRQSMQIFEHQDHRAHFGVPLEERTKDALFEGASLRVADRPQERRRRSDAHERHEDRREVVHALVVQNLPQLTADEPRGEVLVVPSVDAKAAAQDRGDGIEGALAAQPGAQNSGRGHAERADAGQQLVDEPALPAAPRSYDLKHSTRVAEERVARDVDGERKLALSSMKSR